MWVLYVYTCGPSHVLYLLCAVENNTLEDVQGGYNSIGIILKCVGATSVGVGFNTNENDTTTPCLPTTRSKKRKPAEATNQNQLRLKD